MTPWPFGLSAPRRIRIHLADALPTLMVGSRADSAQPRVAVGVRRHDADSSQIRLTIQSRRLSRGRKTATKGYCLTGASAEGFAARGDPLMASAGTVGRSYFPAFFRAAKPGDANQLANLRCEDTSTRPTDNTRQRRETRIQSGRRV